MVLFQLRLIASRPTSLERVEERFPCSAQLICLIIIQLRFWANVVQVDIDKVAQPESVALLNLFSFVLLFFFDKFLKTKRQLLRLIPFLISNN